MPDTGVVQVDLRLLEFECKRYEARTINIKIAEHNQEGVSIELSPENQEYVRAALLVKGDHVSPRKRQKHDGHILSNSRCKWLPKRKVYLVMVADEDGKGKYLSVKPRSTDEVDIMEAWELTSGLPDMTYQEALQRAAEIRLQIHEESAPSDAHGDAAAAAAGLGRVADDGMAPERESVVEGMVDEGGASGHEEDAERAEDGIEEGAAAAGGPIAAAI